MYIYDDIDLANNSAKERMWKHINNFNIYTIIYIYKFQIRGVYKHRVLNQIFVKTEVFVLDLRFSMPTFLKPNKSGNLINARSLVPALFTINTDRF